MGIKRLGFGFLLVLAISSIRHMVRALAWTKCFEAPYSLKFRHALEARLMGDAVGNIVPLASAAVSEPSKAAFVTNRVPLLASLSAIALENIFYSMSVVLFIFSGTTALLLSFSLPKPLRIASIVALVITVGSCAAWLPRYSKAIEICEWSDDLFLWTRNREGVDGKRNSRGKST